MQVGSIQRSAFQQYEADQWFARNKSVLETFDGNKDVVLDIIRQYRIKPLRILEIGSSAGYRLAFCKQLFPEAQVIGIDPSAAAVQTGSELYPDVELHLGTADDLAKFEDSYFDLIIIGFVFYVIDRPLLFKVISEIDRTLADKGFLINTDFYSEKALKTKYHHITEFEAYSFKQRYETIFLASELYQLLHKVSFNHESRHLDASDDYFNKCTATLLKKDLNAAY